MATTTVRPDRRELVNERFGAVRDLETEQHRPARPRPPRGIAAPRCRVCLDNSDQAITLGRGPQPVRRVEPGADACQRHLGRR